MGLGGGGRERDTPFLTCIFQVTDEQTEITLGFGLIFIKVINHSQDKNQNDKFRRP